MSTHIYSYEEAGQGIGSFIATFSKTARQQLLPPFDPLLIEFCEALSEALFKLDDSPSFGHLVALAFWLRKSELLQLKKRFDSLTGKGEVLVPKGLVFHIPPSNVDVMFVYSWLLSLLTGNANIIRLPTLKQPAFNVLFATIQQLLQNEIFYRIDKTTAFLRYKHEIEVTQAVSLEANLRVIWGGDETIRAIRQVPLNPWANELVFADRFSFALIQAERYQQTSQEHKKQVAKAFFNDLYSFDQAACSSPRLIFWVGEPSQIEEASTFFYEALQKVIIEKDYTIELGAVLLKQTFSYLEGLSLPIESINRLSNELTIIKLLSALDFHPPHCGFGLLYHVSLACLEDLIPFITRKDQTLLYEGFTAQEMSELASRLNGKGIDRLVPIGQGLVFDARWDGYDLLQEFTRRIVIKT